MSSSEERRAQGAEVFSKLGGGAEPGAALVEALEGLGALGQIAVQQGAGALWTRTELSRRDRSLIVIAALTGLGRERELRQHLIGGLTHGLERSEIDEVFVQVAAYAGMPCGLGGAVQFAGVLGERDGGARHDTPSCLAARSEADRRSAGLDVLSTLLGIPGADMQAPADATVAQLGEMGRWVLDYAFGDVWSRPQLTRRDRSLVVVALLTALNLTHELEIHLGGALNHGVTPEELDEVMLTMVIYAGFPRAIDGKHLLDKVMAARGAAS
ncbi:MAG: carboxymuconolactone decarboxylase family protein [Myxococcota bacterium]